MFTKKTFNIIILLSFIVIFGCEEIMKSPDLTDKLEGVQKLGEKFIAVPLSTAPDIIVTTTSDDVDFSGDQQVEDLPGTDGVVSLREAIIAANNTIGPNVIGFNIPTSDLGYVDGVFTIRPHSNPEPPLPRLTDDGTSIDGATQTIFSGNSNPSGPEIVLNGSLLPNGGVCLEIISSSNHINNLVINNFSMSGILCSSKNNKVTGCFLGTDHTGTLAEGNENGIDIGDGTNNIIGGINPGEGNLISGNNYNGINLYQSSNNTIRGNLIGTDVTGTKKIPNSNGISISGKNNIVGGVEEASRNLISGNLYGIQISSSETEANIVQGNFIGTDITGSFAVSNEATGIIIRDGAHDNIVGSPDPSAKNLISGNGSNEIFLGDASNNLIQCNFIGTDVTGRVALGKGGDGIRIVSDYASTDNNKIIANLISGNGKNGIGIFGGSEIAVSASQNYIHDNIIGLDKSCTSPIGNGQDGIRIVGEISKENYISNNVISANAENGIIIFSAIDNIIKGNLIGTDKNGNINGFGNKENGIQLQRSNPLISARGNVIGGTAETDCNIIAGNLSGIILDEAEQNIIEGNAIHNNSYSGIVVHSPGIQNSFIANSIYQNGAIGIDLGGDGITTNDPGDVDTGPNNLMNFPVLSFALATPGCLVVQGTIDTPNPQATTIEFFANPVPDPGGDPSGHGEGAVYLGSKHPNSQGKFTVALPAVAPGTLISATATDADGNTSEFSANIEANRPNM